MPLYTDIFGRLDWLTKTVKRLCCNVDKIKTDIEAIQDSGAGSYKVYTAIVTQTGTTDPVVNVLENTIDPDITMIRNEASSYSILSPNNAFTLNKTYFNNDMYLPTSANSIDFKYISVNYNDVNSLLIKTFRISGGSWAEEDSLLTDYKLEIRVYN